jgi:argininosuccinate lyase
MAAKKTTRKTNKKKTAEKSAATEAKTTSKKSWHGRLTAGPDAATAKLLASLDIDTLLWRYDIAGSIAHARMLTEQKIITTHEYHKIKRGLMKVADDIEAGKVHLDIELEDIHMVIESALIKKIGALGGKLHTGRSRNDQVALDLRLWARDAADNLAADIKNLQQAFVALVNEQGSVVMPAYTHLQRAQPILAGHGMLAYVEMLQRDIERLADARKRINICPLGSAAVAGTSIPLNRLRTGQLLGFKSITRNSIDATSDRDFLTELCFAVSMLSVHLSRWAEDWIIYSSTEFGLIELDDAYCTSSSMMPQKKNADTLELIRGKSANSIAQLVGMLTLMKSLPMAYGRDMQDDKRFAFEAVETMRDVLSVAAGIVSTVKIKTENIAANIDKGFLDATALAEYIVNKGVPFRTAHGIVGKLVAAADKKGLSLSDLPLATLQKACKKIEADVSKFLTAKNVVKHYAPDGAAGAKQLKKQLAFWKKSWKTKMK